MSDMEALNIDSSTVPRALDIGTYCDMEMHDAVARLIVAVRLGQRADIFSAAQDVSDQYESLTHLKEFDEAL